MAWFDITIEQENGPIGYRQRHCPLSPKPLAQALWRGQTADRLTEDLLQGVAGAEVQPHDRDLKVFLDSHGKIFSTNYDLLLYWVLMRNSIVEHGDGCGRELENPDASVPPEEQIWSELTWGKNRDTQKVFYVHGALPFFDTGVAVTKEEYNEYQYLLEKITLASHSAIESGSRG